MLNLYIGYDSSEVVAYNVLSHSIQRRASVPVSIASVKLQQLGRLYTRTRGPTESTEFSLSRFLVPALSGFKGWSVFMDCDMLCLSDIAELARETEKQADKAVLVCKHDYVPKTERKFHGHVQTKYPRKNWSSMMIFNNERCRALSPDYVNSASGLELHRFQWIDDSLIGEVHKNWNWLVGEYPHNPEARMVHFTLGGPWFDEYRNCDYSREWVAERESMLVSAQKEIA